MNSFYKRMLCIAMAALVISSIPAANFSGWQFQQEFQAPGPGLVKISLPPETMGIARPNFSDIRLVDSSGTEIPYLIDQPSRMGRLVRRAKSFKMELLRNVTVITIETGMDQPLGCVILETPATSFVKAVTVAGSQNSTLWRTLVSGSAIFQLASGASQLRVEFPAGKWQFLKLTIEGRDTQPTPFTGAEVEATTAEAAPLEPLAVEIAGRVDNSGETRIEISLPAANLRIASIEIETPDLLFRRRATLSTRRVEENVILEKSFASESIYRMAVAGQPASEKLSIPVDFQAPLRELFLRIQNDDSPPLKITGLRAQRWPVHLIFLAPQTGNCTLFAGNTECAAPRYDLGKQGIDIKGIPLASIKMSAVQANPDYRAQEALPQVKDIGKELDVSAWRYRKLVKIDQPGLQQLDLDLETIGRALQSYADLRLMRGGKQLAFIIERTAIRRTLKLESQRSAVTGKSRLSQWIFKMPLPNLPLIRLSCSSPTPLFQRYMTLTEEVTDTRGAKSPRELGSELWKQSADQAAKQFIMALHTAPSTDTLILQTDNEDNPPIELANFEFLWPVTRLYFKTTGTNNIHLYYGNSTAAPPQYDLSLATQQLLVASKHTATLNAAETLKKPSWAERQTPGKGGFLFWGALAVVVIALFMIIARVVPKPNEP